MQTLQAQHSIVELDSLRREALIDGIPLGLGEREYQLLQAIVRIARTHRRSSGNSIAELLKSFHVRS